MRGGASRARTLALALGMTVAAPATAGAATGLGSLEALQPILWGLLIVSLVGLVLLAWVGWKLLGVLRRGTPRQRRLAWSGVAAGLLLVAVSLVPFTDFNFYRLVDEPPESAAEIVGGRVDRYFELEDGRVFYTLGTDRPFEPGDRVVLSAPGGDGSAELSEVYEATRGVFHRRRRRHEGKRFWVPILPKRVSRWQLQERGRAVVLSPDWRVDDLRPDDQPIPWCCDPEWSRLLLAHGADPSRPNGFTLPLTQALAPLGYLRDPERAEAEANLALLLAHGVDLNAVNDAGRTALHLAAVRRDLDSLRWLLERGADPTLRDGRGRTPADLLRENLGRGAALKRETRREAEALLRRLERAARRSPRQGRRGG